MPTISIIIPTYNAEFTIGKTVNTVLNQTFPDFELIVVNDGSKDNTLKVVENVRDSRIKLVSYANGGVAVARNRGMSHAIGEFIAFLDADDMWVPDKLELQLRALRNFPNSGVAYSWTARFLEGDEDTLFYDRPCFYNGDVYKRLLINNFLANGSNPLVRRGAIESTKMFDPACVPCEDWDFYLQLAKNWSFCVVPRHQILYRQSSNSSSANLEKMEKASFYTIQKIYDQAPEELHSLKPKTVAWTEQYLAHMYLQYSSDFSHIRHATRKLIKSAQLYPSIIFDSYYLSLVKLLIRKYLGLKIPSRLKSLLKRNGSI